MAVLRGDSSDPKIPAVQGQQTGKDGTGVSGVALGLGVFGQSTGPNGFSGVRGESTGGAGVSGASVGSVGVDARTQTGPAALRAVSAGNGHGVFGSAPHIGVFGTSTGTEGFSGVHGESIGGPGVSATSVASVGVDAKTQTGPAAVRAISAGNGHGVLGSAPHVGVFGVSTGTGGFSGVHGESTGGPGVPARASDRSAWTRGRITDPRPCAPSPIQSLSERARSSAMRSQANEFTASTSCGAPPPSSSLHLREQVVQLLGSGRQ